MGSYYDVDAILADAQKVPCTFEIDAPRLGFLDDNATRDIKKGAPLRLPLWLAGYLAVQSLGGGPALSMDLPAALAPRVLAALRADARAVDLAALAPHFYELAARALELFDEDAIVDVLTETFKARAAEIADHARNSRGGLLGEVGESPKGLDEMEKQLYRRAHDSSKAAQAWLGELRKRP